MISLRQLLTGSLVLLTLTACQTMPEANRTKVTVWTTNHDEMVFRQQGNQVQADYYPHEHGVILGEMQGNVLQGIWIEDKANQRCKTAVNGRYYWGRVNITFSGTQFRGRWGYCDDALTHDWFGSLKKG